MKNKSKYKEYVLFTMCYAVFSIVTIGICFYNQQLITSGSDGIAQYYPTMCYIAHWLRDVISNLFSGKIEIPLVDYTLGMGEDILVTLNYYGFGDPFYLLLAFVSDAKMPYFFTILFFLRLYLGGLAFILLAKEVVPSRHVSAYVVGAIVYISSGFTVVANLYYNFVHAFLYIPLMLYGVEMILQGKKKRWTIITVFFFALSGFFYLYVGMITSVVYLVYRFMNCKGKYREYFRRCVSWGISFLTGLFLAAFIFLPEVMGYLECTRQKIESIPLYYSLRQYKDMFFKLFFAKEANFQIFAFPIVAIMIIVALLLVERHYKEKVLVILCGICVALPAISFAMSGFGGIYDRWEIVLILLISILVVKNWEELLSITKFEKIGIFNLYLIFLITGYYEDLLSDDGYYRDTLLMFSFLFIAVLLFSFMRTYFHREKIARWGMFLVAVISIFAQIYHNFRYTDMNSVKEQNVVEELVKDDLEEKFYRIDNEQVFNQEKPLLNLGFAQGYRGLGEYFSIINEDYVSALSDWQVLSEHSYHSYGINHRTILEALCNVKYIILEEGHEYLKPYGFEYVSVTSDGRWKLYENEYSMPLGYTYSEAISYDRYLKLDGIEKQQAMLQTVALQGYTGELIGDTETEWTYEKGKCKIIESDGLSILEDGTYIAHSGSTITLLVERKAGCENYFLIEGTNGSIKLSYNDSQEFMEGVSIGTLGYSLQDEQIELTVQFCEEITFQAEQLMMGYLSMEGYEDSLQKLKQEQLEDIEISSNKVRGTICVETDKLLCLSLPYMDGWSAKLDGKEVKIYKANSMFMAIEVPAGEHVVEFSYCTPWLKLGGMISVVTLLVCIVIYSRFKKKTIQAEDCENT